LIDAIRRRHAMLIVAPPAFSLLTRIADATLRHACRHAMPLIAAVAAAACFAAAWPLLICRCYAISMGA